MLMRNSRISERLGLKRLLIKSYWDILERLMSIIRRRLANGIRVMCLRGICLSRKMGWGFISFFIWTNKRRICLKEKLAI